MKKIRSQPRLRDVKRDAAFTALHPEVKRVVRAISRREGKSISWVMAEFTSAGCGVDIATGKPLRIVPFRRTA